MVGVIFQVSGLIIGLTSLILIFILIKYGFKKIHYMWAFFNLAVGSWGFANFFTGLSQNKHVALIFWKLGIVSGIFTAIIFYHVIVILGELRRVRRLIFFYAFGYFFSALTIFNLAGLEVSYLYSSIFYAKASDIRLSVLSGMWACILFYALYELCKLYIKSSGDKKIQFKYLLIGFATGFTGASLTMLPWFGFENLPYPAGNILIWLYLTIVTYAIFRHKLLDIEVIIKKTLVFAGLLASVFAMLILPTLIIQEYIFRGAGLGGRMAGLAISGIIIILTMRRLETFLINVTDKYLFQKKYDYKELLKTFTGEVLTIVEMDKLVNLTVDKLSDIIKLASSAVLLFDDEKQEFNVMASKGVKDSQIKLVRPDGIVTFLEQTHGYLLKKELIQKKIFIPESIQEIIDKLNAELIIPMVLHNEVMGILSLGKKKSDEEYTQDDLDILLPLARTLAIAISNAKLFVELGKTQAEAAQNEKMAVIGTLAAGMAHEIRNPMATIKTFSEFLPEKKGDAEFIDKFERLVPKEIDRIDQIIQHILDFSRPANTAVIEQVDIKEELVEVLEMLGSQMKLENIDFKSELEDIPRISGNRKMVQEVLFNLIQNASHSMKDGGAINVLAENGGNHVILKIKDTGCGIPEDRIRHIFDPFYTTKSDFKSFGLGLFVVRQIMNKLNGKISVESKVGEGTTFTLEFPLAVPQEAKA